MLGSSSWASCYRLAIGLKAAIGVTLLPLSVLHWLRYTWLYVVRSFIIFRVWSFIFIVCGLVSCCERNSEHCGVEWWINFGYIFLKHSLPKYHRISRRYSGAVRPRVLVTCAWFFVVWLVRLGFTNILFSLNHGTCLLHSSNIFSWHRRISMS
jgi:hypothetical protein